MAADAVQRERAYASELLAELARDGRIAVERHELRGVFPDTELVVIFHVSDRECRFGVIHPIWLEEDDPETFDVSRNVTYAYLRWVEALGTGELPRRCRPDDSGTTWLNLWDDW